MNVRTIITTGALALAVTGAANHAATERAQAATVTGSQASTIRCQAGVYGLAGDWGPGSLLANTPANRAAIHMRFRARPKLAYRIIHHIPPVRCR